MPAAFYTPSFTRALRSYARNAFLSRYLDADDQRFIESIRRTGSLRAGFDGTRRSGNAESRDDGGASGASANPAC